MLGYNYAYRFMFLIFAIPQLVAWTKDTDRRTVATLAIAMLLLSFWMPIFHESGFPRWFFVVDEVANWLLYSSLLYLMLGSLPVSLQKWMKLPGDRPRRLHAADGAEPAEA
jgi:peptidoglycan/LPS O-acetylase OafA/YrhL